MCLHDIILQNTRRERPHLPEKWAPPAWGWDTTEPSPESSPGQRGAREASSSPHRPWVPKWLDCPLPPSSRAHPQLQVLFLRPPFPAGLGGLGGSAQSQGSGADGEWRGSPRCPGSPRRDRRWGDAPGGFSPSSFLKFPSAALGLPGEGSPRRARPLRLTQSSAGCGRPGDRPAPGTAAPRPGTHLADTARAAGAPGRAWPGRARGAYPGVWGKNRGRARGSRAKTEGALGVPSLRSRDAAPAGSGSALGTRSRPGAPPRRPAPGPQPIGPSDAGRGGAWTPAGEGRLVPGPRFGLALRSSLVYSWAPGGP